MIYLKKYVKFRKEDGYILLCDCSSIQNYELPLEMYDFLINLKNGIKEETIPKEYNELIEDFKELNLLSGKQNDNSGFHDNEWISLGYSESEFF